MTRYRYFPGCSLHSTAAEYDASCRAIFRKLGLTLEEVEDWSCCGSTPLHGTDKILSLALPYYNINQAARDPGTELVVPCASCYARMKSAQYHVRQDAAVRAATEEVLGEPCAEGVAIRHPLEILGQQVGIPAIAKAVTRPFPGIKVACYYGCLLTRPPKIMQFDEAEYPTSMDRLLTALGLVPVPWSCRTECCGASLTLTEPEMVRKLVKPLVEDARSHGAELLVTACPLCQANLESRQNQEAGALSPLPTLYFTQLLGLALGEDPRTLGIQKLLIDPGPVLFRSAPTSSPS